MAAAVATILYPALVDAGYDESFERLPADRPRSVDGSRPLSLLGPADIEITGTTVRLPAGRE